MSRQDSPPCGRGDLLNVICLPSRRWDLAASRGSPALYGDRWLPTHGDLKEGRTTVLLWLKGPEMLITHSFLRIDSRKHLLKCYFSGTMRQQTNHQCPINSKIKEDWEYQATFDSLGVRKGQKPEAEDIHDSLLHQPSQCYTSSFPLTFTRPSSLSLWVWD